jgi:plastocyanin
VSKLRSPSVVLLAALALSSIGAPSLGAQGTVSGQIKIQERPGETTSDLGNTVVFLEPVTAPKTKVADTVKQMTTQMAMQGRQFTPRVQVVTAGSKVVFPNQDPFSHNIFSNTPGAMFDLGLYGRGGSKDATFKKAGAFPIYCNIHPRMTGFVVSVSTPYFAQAGADGRYTIANVPPGKYTVHFWHERAPEVTRELTVTASGSSGNDAQLDARGYKFVAHKNKFGQEYTSTGKDRY